MNRNSAVADAVSLSENKPNELLEQNVDEADARLIADCLSGDERAWEKLLNRYGRLIYTIPLRMGFSVATAEEIYQEICLILLEKLDTIREQRSLSTWLFTVTKRTCIQRLRQRKSVISLDDMESLSADIKGLEEQMIFVEKQEMVRLAIESLDARCKSLIHALFTETPAPSYDILAERLGIALGSVGPTRARCLEKLRQILALASDGE